jgi:hypothetical protein
MSDHTAKLSLRRKNQNHTARGQAYPVEGQGECYTHDENKVESKNPRSFHVKSDSAPQLADSLGQSFGGYAALTMATQSGDRRCFCWTAGTGLELRYKSPSFLENDGKNPRKLGDALD